MNDKVLPKAAYNLFKDLIEGIPSNRPIDEIVARSITNSPIIVKTPNKTELYRSAHYGCITLFTNEPITPSLTQKIKTPQKVKLIRKMVFINLKNIKKLQNFMLVLKNKPSP